jgi:hypothetical protein
MPETPKRAHAWPSKNLARLRRLNGKQDANFFRMKAGIEMIDSSDFVVKLAGCDVYRMFSKSICVV